MRFVAAVVVILMLVFAVNCDDEGQVGPPTDEGAADTAGDGNDVVPMPDFDVLPDGPDDTDTDLDDLDGSDEVDGPPDAPVEDIAEDVALDPDAADIDADADADADVADADADVADADADVADADADEEPPPPEPDTTITSAPLSTTSSTSATFAFTSTIDGSTFECRLDLMPWESCSSPVTYDVNTTWHRFLVRAVADEVVDSTPDAFEWRVTGGSAPVLPDSATATCTDGEALVACPADPQGQDGDYLLHVPTYETTDDTVTDPVTGLVWQRQLTATFDAASAGPHCDELELAGETDWRLPTLFELITIIDAGRIGPGFDTTAFPSIPENSAFRSSTLAELPPSLESPPVGVGVWTNYPVIDYVASDEPHLVRCVRGSPILGYITSYSAETVWDTRTSLIWQSGIAATERSWLDALLYCENLELGGETDWRLPSLKELASIIDHTTADPAIDPIFSECPSAGFWTSTIVPAATVGAYAIDFMNGLSVEINNAFSTEMNVRCVRSSH